MHVLSGQEERVCERLRRKVEAEEMGDDIFDIIVPTEKVTEIRKGKTNATPVRREVKRKFYPGYVLVNMNLLLPDGDLNKKVWYFMLQTDGVIGFAGSRDKPMPMREKEVQEMLAQIKERSEQSRPSVDFKVGDMVRVLEGAFADQEGKIEEVDHEKGKLRVSITIFDRMTPLDLEFWKVEKQ